VTADLLAALGRGLVLGVVLLLTGVWWSALVVVVVLLAAAFVALWRVTR
jgi:hypothetical protein